MDGSSQDTKRTRADQGYSRTVKHKWRDNSGQRRIASKRGELTLCRTSKEEQVKTESWPASKAHLRSVERRARGSSDQWNKAASDRHSQTVERRGRDKSRQRRNPASEGHSPTVKRRRRDKLGQQKKSQSTRDNHQLRSAEGVHVRIAK